MKQYIVDAFTNQIFHGNQAAVCVLEQWLPDELMMNIAKENNFSETAFTVRRDDGYDLRWFTPGGEIDFCGHATLATSYVLFRFYVPDAERLVFCTKRGQFFVSRRSDLIVMDFPAYQCKKTSVTKEMTAAMGVAPVEAYLDRDLLLVYDDESVVREMKPDLDKTRSLDGLLVAVTSPGSAHDCVSRVFAPKLEVPEDPVTGSAHCMIVPYWAKRLGKSSIHAFQASARGGELVCEQRGERVVIAGRAALFSIAELSVPC